MRAGLQELCEAGPVGESEVVGREIHVVGGVLEADAGQVGPVSRLNLPNEDVRVRPFGQRVCGKPRSTFEVAGSGQREVTTFPRV